MTPNIYKRQLILKKFQQFLKYRSNYYTHFHFLKERNYGYLNIFQYIPFYHNPIIPSDVDKMNSLDFWSCQNELLIDVVYIATKHIYPPHTPKWINYMKYGLVWTVLTTLSSLGDFKHLLLGEPWRKLFHFNNRHYDLQFKRKKN